MARTLEALVIAELGQLRYMVLVQQAQLEDCREKLAKAEHMVAVSQIAQKKPTKHEAPDVRD